MSDVLLWLGGNGTFNAAGSWNNLSSGNNPSLVAPGAQDFAIVTGTDGQVVSGPGNAGFLEVLADTSFTGTYNVSSINEVGTDYLTTFQVRSGKTATFGAGSTLNVTNENASIGVFTNTTIEAGHLVLNAGADMTIDVTDLTSSMYICTNGSTGLASSSVLVDGAGTTLGVDAGIQVGFGTAGDARLTVSNGAQLTMAAANSFGFYVGASGITHGFFNLNSGADVINTGFTNIARSSGGTGTVVVENAGTTWSDVSIAIGYSGTGSLTLRDQAAITTTALTLGTVDGSGTLDVTDANSLLTVTSQMAVGGALSDGGSGVVNVTNAGRLDVGGSLVLWGDGTLNVNTSGVAEVGTTAATVAGALNIQSGGVVEGTGTINAPVVNSGILQSNDFDTSTLADKTLTVNGNITGTGLIKLQGDSTLVLNGSVGAGQTVFFDDIFAGADSTLILTAAGAAGFNAQVVSFDPHDRIRLSNTIATAASFDTVTNVLTVLNGVTTVASLTLSDDNDDDTFVVTSDGGTGVYIETANKPPVITSGGGGASTSVSVFENTNDAVYLVTASEPDNDPVSVRISGGADQDQFFIGFSSDLHFLGIPNFEAPTDANHDNVYEVIIEVSDGRGGIDTQTVTVTVKDNINPIVGDNNNNSLQGFLESETLLGLGGNDILDGGFFGKDDDPDTLNGGAGNDTYVLGYGSDKVIDASGIDTITSTISRSLAAYPAIENLTLLESAAINGTGNALANVITGNGAANTLNGAAGNDSLIGGGGRDVLIGNSGRDVLTGGLGADRFDFDLAAHTGKTAATRDIVKDFTHSSVLSLSDRIDLSTIDANGALAGNGVFKFLAAKGAAFTGVKGQIHWLQINSPNNALDKTIIEGDIDGNKVADFQIELTGLKTLVAADFIL